MRGAATMRVTWKRRLPYPKTHMRITITAIIIIIMMEKDTRDIPPPVIIIPSFLFLQVKIY